MVSSRADILWFTRGVSFGHATRDAAILDALTSRAADLAVHVVSYGNGYDCLSGHGVDVSRLPVAFGWLHRMSEADLLHWFTSAVAQFTTLIRERAPRLVVADEEFLASIAAGRCRIPSLLLTDKLPTELSGTLAAFVSIAWDFYSTILIPDEHSLFVRGVQQPLPPNARCVGPVVRWPKAFPSRAEVRKQLGAERDSRVILVMNGGNSNTTRIFDIAAEAAALAAGSRLRWIFAGPYAPRTPAQADVSVRPTLPHEWLPCFAACDAIVTGAGLSTLNELMWLDVPCAVLPSRNRFQQRDAQRITPERGVVLDLEQCTGPQLLAVLRDLLTRKRDAFLPLEADVRAPAARAAQYVLAEYQESDGTLRSVSEQAAPRRGP